MKTMNEWIRDHPVMLVNIMRAQVAASHLLLMEEIRAMQGKQFDMVEELTLLLQRQTSIAEVFDLKMEEAAFQRLKERREARRQKREKQ